jgi:hypothetical protein
MKSVNLLSHFWKTLLVLLIILILCLIPAKDIQKIDFLKISFEDLVVHGAMFFSFTWFIYRDLQKYTSLSNRLTTLSLIVLFCGICLGIMTEMLQYIFTALNRTASFTDFIFDLLGTLAGITTLRLIGR